jgi:hypothetical protein
VLCSLSAFSIKLSAQSTGAVVSGNIMQAPRITIGTFTSPFSGLILLDTTTHHFFGYNGSEWVPFDSGGVLDPSFPVDSTDFLDSTGQPQFRSLFAVHGGKIGSTPYILIDSGNHRLIVNNSNVSFATDLDKIAVDGRIYTTGLKLDIPVSNQNNYLAIDPITKVAYTDTFVALRLIRSDTFLLRNDTLFVDTSGSGGGSGAVESVTGNIVDNTDPANPVVTGIDQTTLDDSTAAIRADFPTVTTDGSTNDFTVINVTNTPPVSPATDDQYRVGTSPTGAWVAHANNIATWNGSSWTFTAASTGDYVYQTSDSKTYQFKSDNTWHLSPGIPIINNRQSITNGMKIGLTNNKTLSLYTNNLERLRIDNSGHSFLYSVQNGTSSDSLYVKHLGEFRALLNSTDNVPQGSTNLYWSNALGDARYNKLSDTSSMLSPYLRTNIAAATYRTQSQVRSDISLTTTGTSGAATYNNSTGVLNVPQYTGGSGSAIDTVATIADLYAYSALGLKNGNIVYVKGYWTKADGGGGFFQWDSTSTSTDDSGYVIKPTVVTNGRFLRPKSDDWNAFYFGAIPNGSRLLANRLQLALNKQGHVKLPYHPQAFLIDNRLVIKTNTWLDVDLRDTIYEVSGTNTVLLRNEHMDSAARSQTDSNIIVTGGMWNGNWSGNPGTNDFSSYLGLRSDKTSPARGVRGNLSFIGVKNLTVGDMTIMNPVTNAIQIFKGYHFEVKNIRFYRDVATISDGIHVGGFTNDFYIHNITGKTGDDFIALIPWEWVMTAPGGGAANGTVNNGIVEDIRADTAVWAIIKIYAGDTCKATNIIFNNITGVSVNSGVAILSSSLEPDVWTTSHIATMGSVADLTFNNLRVATTTSITSAAGITYGQPVLLACDAKNISINGSSLDSLYKQVSPLPWFSQYPGTALSQFTIENFNEKDSIAGYSYLFDFNGSSAGVKLSNSNFYGSGSFAGNRAYGVIRVNSGASAKSVQIENNHFKKIAGALWVSSSSVDTLNVALNGNTFDTISNAVLNGYKMNATVVGNSFKKIASVIQTFSYSYVSTAGNTWDSSGIALDKQSGSVRWNGIDLLVDKSLLTPKYYDIVNNNGTGIKGLSQWDGTQWNGLSAFSFANPSTVLSLTTVNGTASTAMRSDAAPAISQSIAPTWTQTHTFSNGVAIVNAIDNTTGLNARFGTFGIQSYAINNGWLSDNLYFDGANFKYVRAGYGVLSYFSAGGWAIYTAPSSSAGATATTTQGFRCFLGGNVAVGTSTTDNGAMLQVGGSISIPYVAKTGTYTVTAADHTINCTSGTFTVTLPTAASIAGRQYTIVNSGSGTITIGTTSSQTFVNITGGPPTTLTLGAVGAAAIVSYTVESNGANWIVTGKVKNE